MKPLWAKIVSRCASSFIAAAIVLGTGAANAYNLGGVGCAVSPGGFSSYCYDGAALLPFRAAVADPVNFGPGGVVSTPIVTTVVNTFPAGLAGIDGLVVAWWQDSDAAPHVASVKAFFEGGGDLFILADDSFHDPINEALGLPTIDDGGLATFRPTSGTAPLHAGPFGLATTVNQAASKGRLDTATVILRGGHVVGLSADGHVTAAVWDKNEYAPGAGRLIIVTDVDSINTFTPELASYAPLNDNGRFALNAAAFLATGGTVDEITYKLIGVPSCAISPQGFGAYCGANGTLFGINVALGNPAYFGPAGTVTTRFALAEFSSFTPDLASVLTAVIVPWIADADAAPYAAALRDYFLAGGNLWLLQDDPFHDPIGELLGLTTAFAGPSPRSTNGIAPIYAGPFGLATDVDQFGNVGALSAADVAAHGGTVVGTAANGDIAVAVWLENAYAPGAGRMVIATDVDTTNQSLFDPLNAEGIWSLNTIAFLGTDPPADTTAPSITCAATPNFLWPPNGKPVTVRVTGTISDAGSGVQAGSTAYSVVDEYGQPQPSGAVVVTAGAYAFNAPLVASRDGGDRDGRKYTIHVSASDQAGNIGTCSVDVIVPHDQRGK